MKQYALHQLRFPLVCLLLMIGVFADRTQPVLGKEIKQTKEASHLEKVNTNTPANIQAQKSVKNSKVVPMKAMPQQDGIYLYGQSSKPNQIGQGYIVFEKQQGRVIGALYMPQSELSCFNGTVDPKGKLAMTVTGYPGEESQTQVATNSRIPRLVNYESSAYAHSISLEEYYPLNASANDSRILQMCKNE